MLVQEILPKGVFERGVFEEKGGEREEEEEG